MAWQTALNLALIIGGLYRGCWKHSSELNTEIARMLQDEPLLDVHCIWTKAITGYRGGISGLGSSVVERTQGNGRYRAFGAERNFWRKCQHENREVTIGSKDAMRGSIRKKLELTCLHLLAHEEFTCIIIWE